MVWVVDDHLNCSTRPAAWTLCTFDVINGSVLAGMGVVGVVLNSLVLYILLIAKVKIGGKQASYSVTTCNLPTFCQFNTFPCVEVFPG